jgi:ribosomal protein L37AE/L43A
MDKNETSTKLKCPKCKHIQNSKSVLILITCSSCNRKFNKKDNKIEIQDNGRPNK